MAEQVSSKPILVNDMSRFVIVELPAPVTFDARKEVAQRIASALERPAPEPPAAPMKMHVDYEWQKQRLESGGPAEECAAGGPSKPVTTGCIWEDCDQEAIYCAGHAREFAAPTPPPAVVQDMEGIAWCQKVHEDLALYVSDGGGQMIDARAHRALGIMFTELEKLEKALWPLTK